MSSAPPLLLLLLLLAGSGTPRSGADLDPHVPKWTGRPHEGDWKATPPSPVSTAAPETSGSDPFVGPPECLQKRHTRRSCDLVFCPPWEHCVDKQCLCKLPYWCPTENVTAVCGRDGHNYRSYCQLMALSCRTKISMFSHFGEHCAAGHPTFSSSILPESGAVRIFLPDARHHSVGEELLVCWKVWNMAAANVVCREHGHPLGASRVTFRQYKALTESGQKLPGSCVSVHCQGYENSLAECLIYDSIRISNKNRKVAAVTCYNETQATTVEEAGFTCVNNKRVSLNQTCDGVDDCGDRSDEMCCQSCRKNSFRCKTGVCVHKGALGDGQLDCLDGEDEVSQHKESSAPAVSHTLKNNDYVPPKKEILANRLFLKSRLFGGIPNMTLANEENAKERGRRKRVVGGVPTRPTQIKWQVALEENRKINCGGAYIGGCWVLTAAHCVRPNPSAFMVKFSLWRKTLSQHTTDIVPVKEIFIHPRFNASSYENDIALVKLKPLPFKTTCFEENPAVRAICVPWTTQLFQANHTCSISGWGRTSDGGKASQVLLWANVSLITDCERFYQERLRPGMMCAGDLNSTVDFCEGDDGGPLVCQDELGVSYLWGIISWGERCGHSGSPGVYTQVAHYFEWIRLHTGWPAVTRFDS